MDNVSDSPRSQGIISAMVHEHLKDNPYPHDPQATEWQSGYVDARHKIAVVCGYMMYGQDVTITPEPIRSEVGQS